MDAGRSRRTSSADGAAPRSTSPASSRSPEGNPLFLEELAASIPELGDDGALPVTVREAIAARIDAMPPDARATLLSAAVVGKTFWRGVVAAVGGADDVDEALAPLEARDLVRREPTSQLAGDVEFTFKHMLIREVAYATVARAPRRQRHAAVAAYVEETIEGSSETLAWVLAHHWREAGEPARAIPYLLAAAEAARGWAQDAVVDLYTEALSWPRTRSCAGRFACGAALRWRARRVRDGGDRARPAAAGARGREAARGVARPRPRHALDGAARRDDRDRGAGADLAAELGNSEAMPAALALQSQGYGMRGAEGDLDRALELGDRALVEWVPGTRAFDYAEHLHLHADATVLDRQLRALHGALASGSRARRRHPRRRGASPRRRHRGARPGRARPARGGDPDLGRAVRDRSRAGSQLPFSSTTRRSPFGRCSTSTRRAAAARKRASFRPR